MKRNILVKECGSNRIVKSIPYSDAKLAKEIYKTLHTNNYVTIEEKK